MNQNFRDAALFADIEALKEFLSKEPNIVNEADQYGFTALHEAVGEDSLEVVKLLISAGANVDAQNNVGIAPLHLATYDYNAFALLEAGASIDITERNGGTPLHIYAENPEQLDVMKVLLKKGANVYAKDNSQLGIIDIAKSYSGKEMVDLIKSYTG